jgi:hypothetical protein
MIITDAAETLAVGDEKIRMRTGADLKPGVMSPDVRFPEWGING